MSMLLIFITLGCGSSLKSPGYHRNVKVFTKEAAATYVSFNQQPWRGRFQSTGYEPDSEKGKVMNYVQRGYTYSQVCLTGGIHMLV